MDPTCTTNTTRPLELFYKKLTPLLAECNLKVTDPRRKWPMPVLKRVLKELSAETPKDLLSKEIWCYSANAVEWRKSVRRYSLSIIFMRYSAALTLTNFFLFHDFSGTWLVQGLRSPVASQRAAMRAEVSFVISELPLRPNQT